MSAYNVTMQLLAAAVSGGALMTVINNIFARQKVRSDAAATSVETALTVLRAVSQELTDARAELALAEQAARRERLRAETAEDLIRSMRYVLSRYYRRVDYLSRLAESSGVNPEDWTPPSIDAIQESPS